MTGLASGIAAELCKLAFLRRYREDVIKRVHAERQIEARIAEYERELHLSLSGISRMAEEKPEPIQIAS